MNIGTHDYMAPELFRPPAKAKDIDLKLADLWAVGVTAYYLLTKDKGFRDWRSSDSLKTPSADLWLLPGIQGRRVSADGLAFILKVTMESPDERLRWEETSNHAWVSHYKRMFSAFSVEEDEYVIALPILPLC